MPVVQEYKITDIPTTATTPATDDYVELGGSTNGSRKISTDNMANAAITALKVDSIAALKAIVPTTLRPVIEVLGYYTAGDGGGGLFRYASGSVDADNSGTIIAPTSGIGRWLRVINDDFVSVAWFGALADGADRSSQIQLAVNYAVSTGSKRVVFPQGVEVGSAGRRYNIGSTTINIPKAEIKLTGPKYFALQKSGSGAFFEIAINGYGFEAENMLLLGDATAGAVGFEFSGVDIGPYYQGPLNSSIHDCWFEAVGDPAVADETAGGAVLITSQTLGFRFDSNIISQGGYAVRNTNGSDGMKITHNVSNVSRSVAIQIIGTAGAAAYEISNNNLANVGGAVYLRGAGYVNVFGNSAIPGEAGSLGDMVKRDYTSTSLAEDAGGASALYIFHSSQAPKVMNNLAAIGAAGITGDYGFYFGDTQGQGTVAFNRCSGADVAQIRVSAQQMTYLNNHGGGGAEGGDLYSDPIHPGIIHVGWDGVGNYYLGFSTANPTASHEFAGKAVTPTDGASQFKISNRDDPNEYIGLGWNDSITAGYLQAYKTGVGYQDIVHRSGSVFQGASGDTVHRVRLGLAQGSDAHQLTDATGATIYFRMRNNGTLAALLGTFADNAAALAGGLVATDLYKTATGEVRVVV